MKSRVKKKTPKTADERPTRWALTTPESPKWKIWIPVLGPDHKKVQKKTKEGLLTKYQIVNVMH